MERIEGHWVSNMPLCGVHAVAHVADKSVKEMFYMFKRRFNKPGQWRGRVTHQERGIMLNQLGIEYKHVVGTTGTLSRWVDWHTSKSETYIIETSCHVQVVRDGVVTDQSETKPIDKYRWKRARVVRAIVIKGKR
jgi:hypothetical protein